MPKFNFSSMNFPETERVSAFQERYADIANVEIEPYQNKPSYIHLKGHLLPNLEVCRINFSSHIARHTKAHVAAETRDNVALILSINSASYFNFQKTPPAYLNKNDALLVSSDSVHVIDSGHSGEIVVINCPRLLLEHRLANLGDQLMKKIATPAKVEFSFLKNYAMMLLQTQDELSPELAQL